MSEFPLVSKTTVFACGFFAVARPAKWLPVAAIPEQFLVTFVRFDVVDASRRFNQAATLALSTERMGTKEALSGFSPFVAIAQTGGRHITLPASSLSFLLLLSIALSAFLGMLVAVPHVQRNCGKAPRESADVHERHRSHPE